MTPALFIGGPLDAEMRLVGPEHTTHTVETNDGLLKRIISEKFHYASFDITTSDGVLRVFYLGWPKHAVRALVNAYAAQKTQAG